MLSTFQVHTLLIWYTSSVNLHIPITQKLNFQSRPSAADVISGRPHKKWSVHILDEHANYILHLNITEIHSKQCACDSRKVHNVKLDIWAICIEFLITVSKIIGCSRTTVITVLFKYFNTLNTLIHCTRSHTSMQSYTKHVRTLLRGPVGPS